MDLQQAEGAEYWKASVLCKRKNECKNGYQPGTNLGKEENGYPPLQNPPCFEQAKELHLTMSGKLKYMQLSY